MSENVFEVPDQGGPKWGFLVDYRKKKKIKMSSLLTAIAAWITPQHRF
jgi:hypothetical protein